MSIVKKGLLILITSQYYSSGKKFKWVLVHYAHLRLCSFVDCQSLTLLEKL